MTNNIQISLQDGVRKILINRPEKKNSFSPAMYKRMANVLNEDAKNDDIVVTILTGVGDFFSSGTDISSGFTGESSLDQPKVLIQALIDYPKLLIVVVNGPAIGIAATLTALCDIVYASDRATFSTPFLKLGLCAEGGSSFMFPRTLGRSKASEVLFLNKKLTSQEAYRLGFISEVIPHEKIPSFINGLYKYGSLPLETLKINKGLIMSHLKNTLTDANTREFEALEVCIESDEFNQAIIEFLAKKKSKL